MIGRISNFSCLNNVNNSLLVANINLDYYYSFTVKPRHQRHCWDRPNIIMNCPRITLIVMCLYELTVKQPPTVLYFGN